MKNINANDNKEVRKFAQALILAFKQKKVSTKSIKLYEMSSTIDGSEIGYLLFNIGNTDYTYRQEKGLSEEPARYGAE